MLFSCSLIASTPCRARQETGSRPWRKNLCKACASILCAFVLSACSAPSASSPAVSESSPLPSNDQAQTTPASPVQSEKDAVSSAPVSISWEGTLFTCGGESWDVRDLAPAVNAILDATEVGDGNVVIDGHVNPRYGIYLIFDTSTREFVQVFPGTNLIWRDSDITTAVYQYENDILDYAGHILGRLELEDGAFIHDLAFGKADGQDAILLTIFSDSGERQEELPLLPLILGEFEDILGLSGWYQEEPGSFRIRTYYTRLDGETVPIAESWGFAPDDHPLDLDGDGVGELVCNCVYGGDGVRTAIVYRRNGDVIEKGELQPEFLPEWSDEVPLQYHSWYQEEDGTFHLQYLTPGADAAEQIHTLADLTFEPYRFLPAS